MQVRPHRIEIVRRAEIREHGRPIRPVGAGQLDGQRQALERGQLPGADGDACRRRRERVAGVDVHLNGRADRLCVSPQPGDQHTSAADADARHRSPPLPTAAVHERYELAERADALAFQACRDERAEPSADRMLGPWRRDRPLRGDLLDQLQRHGRQARLAVFLDRRLQMRFQYRRTVAQRGRDQVVAHRAQQLRDVDRLGVFAVEVQSLDRLDRQALHARAQRGEFGATVAAQRHLGQLLGTIGHRSGGRRLEFYAKGLGPRRVRDGIEGCDRPRACRVERFRLAVRHMSAREDVGYGVDRRCIDRQTDDRVGGPRPVTVFERNADHLDVAGLHRDRKHDRVDATRRRPRRRFLGRGTGHGVYSNWEWDVR